MLNHLYLLIFALSCSSLCAEPTQLKKYYCSPECIELNDSSILVHHEGQVIEVDALRVDQGGVYFEEEAMRCVKCRRSVNPRHVCDYSQSR